MHENESFWNYFRQLLEWIEREIFLVLEEVNASQDLHVNRVPNFVNRVKYLIVRDELNLLPKQFS